MNTWITIGHSLVDQLKVKYQETDIFLTNEATIYCNDFYLKGFDSDVVFEYENNNELNKDEKTLCRYAKMAYLYTLRISNTRCSQTDDFIAFILKKLKLNFYPIACFLNSSVSLYIGPKDQVEVCPRYIISKDDLLLIIDNDKQLKVERAFALGEPKITVNMIVVAYNFYKKMNEDNRKNKDSQTVYSIRVIGTKFTFYKVTIPYSYLDSLDNGFPNEEIIVYRFPAEKKSNMFFNTPPFHYFDYLDVKDRYIITDTLLQLASLFN